MQDETVRAPARLRDRLLQALAAGAVLAGTAALAAPVIQHDRLGGARPAVLAVDRASFVSRPVAAPEKLIWQGADVDGDGQADFANPTGKDIRQTDAYGCGEFGASRDGGSRDHEGVDFRADANQPLVAPISGYVSKIGYAYPGDETLKFVEITNPALHYEARVFYIDPSVQVGEAVAIGHQIGTHHTLERKYPGGMTDHVHLELIDTHGQRFDATRVITARYVPATAAVQG
jgi:murein DD-endopeptidase MepM/ murein hydrolase activator NlpD